MNKRVLGIVALCVAFVDHRPGVGQVLGPEFQVNAQTTDAVLPAVAMKASGAAIVVWYDWVGTINARFYDAQGNSEGVEFPLDTGGGPHLWRPDIAIRPDGTFVVVWEDHDSAPIRIVGRRFDASGHPVGAPFPVATVTVDMREPALSMDPEGAFVVVWKHGTDFFPLSIFGRRFGADAAPKGEPFQINEVSFCGRPDVAVDASGRFVAVWHAAHPGTGTDVYARQYDETGTPLAGEFLVTPDSPIFKGGALVAADASGNFVVVWGTDGLFEIPRGMFGRRFDSSGTPVGPEFPVSSSAHTYTGAGSIAMLPDGRFLVTFLSSEDGSYEGVYGQCFSASGHRIGQPFAINSVTQGQQTNASVGIADSEEFLVVWQSLEDLQGPTRIEARRGTFEFPVGPRDGIERAPPRTEPPQSLPERP